MIRAVWVCLLVLLINFTAAAHTRSQSFSVWDIQEDGAAFTFAVDALRITQLGSLYPEETDISRLLALHLDETLSVSQNGVSCEITHRSTSVTQAQVRRISGRVDCPMSMAKSPPIVVINAFFAVSPTHLHLARLQSGDEETDYILREGRENFILQDGARPQSFWGFVSVGFHHVLSGLDHLVFLVGLALVARTPRQAVLCITGFTLGHTAALGLTTYGLIAPDTRLVEAMIGFTIAVMALEASVPPRYRLRAFLAFAALTAFITALPFLGRSSWGIGLCLAVYAGASGALRKDIAARFLPILTVAFGLIHGAGFAGGLQELSLSQVGLALPLVGFNVGVELAQLLALAVIYILFLVLANWRPQYQVKAENFAALLIFGLGSFWFAQRLWA